MSGHSKWATIKHKKGALDAKRGKAFTKIIKEITIAARIGGGDPDANPRLRTAIVAAKAENMPADNIKRAIQKGTGELPGAAYEEVVYEGYGPGGVAMLLEVTTDNKNRTLSEIRHIFSKHAGNLGEHGSVGWMFTKRGYIVVEKGKASEETLLELVTEAGADDMAEDGSNWEVFSPPAQLHQVVDRLKTAQHHAGCRGSLHDPPVLREADRQTGGSDAPAHGRARRPRGRPARLRELRHRGGGASRPDTGEIRDRLSAPRTTPAAPCV